MIPLFILTQLLTGKSIPPWINRLATICVRFPFLASCIPKEWLKPDGGLGVVDLNEWEEINFPEGEDDGDDTKQKVHGYYCSYFLFFSAYRMLR